MGVEESAQALAPQGDFPRELVSAVKPHKASPNLVLLAEVTGQIVVSNNRSTIQWTRRKR